MQGLPQGVAQGASTLTPERSQAGAPQSPLGQLAETAPNSSARACSQTAPPNLVARVVSSRENPYKLHVALGSRPTCSASPVLCLSLSIPQSASVTTANMVKDVNEPVAPSHDEKAVFHADTDNSDHAHNDVVTGSRRQSKAGATNIIENPLTVSFIRPPPLPVGAF